MTQLNDKSQGNTKVTVINPEGNMDTGFQGNPSSSYLKVHKTKGHGINKAKASWDISQDNSSTGGCKGEVRGWPKSAGFILPGPQVSGHNSLAIHPIFFEVFQCEPKGWTTQQIHIATNSMATNTWSTQSNTQGNDTATPWFQWMDCENSSHSKGHLLEIGWHRFQQWPIHQRDMFLDNNIEFSATW